MIIEDKTWGVSTSTTASPGTKWPPFGPDTEGGGGDGDSTPSKSLRLFHLLTEWISEYPTGGYLVTKNDTPWSFNFNCLFYTKYWVFDNNTYSYPENITSIRLSLYEINDKSFTIDGKTYNSNTYPALKEVGKKLPSNHLLSGKIADNEGTYTEVCTWIVNNNNHSVDSVQLNTTNPLRGYYKKQLKFNIDYNLNIIYNGTKFTPKTQSNIINTNFVNGKQLQINKKYFVKVIPLFKDDNNRDLVISSNNLCYVPLNSNEFVKLVNNSYSLFPNNNELSGVTSFSFDNQYNASFYRSGEGYLLFNGSDSFKIKSRKISTAGPIGTIGSQYDYIKNPFIIPESINQDDYNIPIDSDPLASLSSDYEPWTIRFDAKYTNYVDNVVDLYYSPLAWFKTPKNDYVDTIKSLKTTSYKEWTDPDPSTDGYWYQMWDSWVYGPNGYSVRKGVSDTTKPVGFTDKNYGGYFDNNLHAWGSLGAPISYPIHYYFNKTFTKDFNYHFKVTIKNSKTSIKLSQTNLELITPWKDRVSLNINYDSNSPSKIEYNVFSNINSFKITSRNWSTDTSANGDIHKYNNFGLAVVNLSNEYSYNVPNKPIDKVVSKTNPQNPLTLTANTLFNVDNFSIEKVSIYDSKWTLQGYAAYTKIGTGTQDIIILNGGVIESSNGWHYFDNKFIYSFHYANANVNCPFGSDNIDDYFSDKKQDEKYIEYNFISRYIDVQTFNLSFDYTNSNTYLKISIYNGNKLPNSMSHLDELIKSEDVIKIGEIDASNWGKPTQGTKQNCEYVGLEGNQYIFIVATKSPNASANFSNYLKIENLKIEGEYHKLNNTLFIDLDSSYKSTVATFLPSYSIKLGKGNNVNSKSNDIYIVNSKIGNSNFYSGIWETGVWQSGWRDSKQYSFIDVDQFFSYDNDRIWRFIISGNTLVSNYDLNIGDKISISNIVAIDINNDRRLIKNYFKISEISGTSLVVEFVYDFPIKSIEKDSDNHLILVTKSVWLHGIFLNGRFKGNWIDGIFKGYPFITKMEESHWIDGDFHGGHFRSNIIRYKFDSFDHDSMGKKDEVYTVIKTKQPNSFKIDDSFYLTDNDYNSITRESKVLSVINEYEFYSDIRHDEVMPYSTKIVYVSTNKSSGLIQNINFNSDNTSVKTISKSFVSDYIFSYNSWLDLVYDKSSATNIFKPQNIPDNFGGFYSENNLYGYITNDVLSSVSKFKDSFSNTIREYKLGTKWKIFYDYIGESSSFDEYFHSVYTPKKISELGWSLNVSNNPIPSISRFIGYRTDDKNEEITGKELKLVSEGDGGILNLDNRSVSNIPLRYTEKIKPNGYSFISFDLISKDVLGTRYQKGNDFSSKDQLTWYNGTYSIVDPTSKYEPILSFSNINQTNIIRGGKTFNTPMTYLPVYENINHLETKNKTKIEYFFNKRDLMISLKGSGVYGVGTASVIIDNLKFYETDMIPFFQYFTIKNINKGVQIPNGIDYVKFDYNTSINYSYVSPTTNKTYDYFDDKLRFKSTFLIDDSFWIKDNNLNSLNINDFFNRSI